MNGNLMMGHNGGTGGVGGGGGVGMGAGGGDNHVLTSGGSLMNNSKMHQNQNGQQSWFSCFHKILSFAYTFKMQDRGFISKIIQSWKLKMKLFRRKIATPRNKAREKMLLSLDYDSGMEDNLSAFTNNVKMDSEGPKMRKGSNSASYSGSRGSRGSRGSGYLKGSQNSKTRTETGIPKLDAEVIAEQILARAKMADES